MASQSDMPAFHSFTKTWHSEPYSSISPKRPELSVGGKNVVVTGGGSGIGKAIATGFAQAGAKSVSILGRNVEKLKDSAAAISTAAGTGPEILYKQADLLNRGQVDEALKSITDKVGKIDILVSNAGTLPKTGLLADYNVDDFMHGIDLNVRSALNVIQAFVPLAGPEPILLNISTAMAHFAPAPGVSAYTVAKAANLKMVDYFAKENPQIHVVNIQPGWTPTELNNYQEEAPDSADLPGQFCVWLASSEAKFLKSKYVWANWDVEELVQRADEIKNSKLLLTVHLDGVEM